MKKIYLLMIMLIGLSAQAYEYDSFRYDQDRFDRMLESHRQANYANQMYYNSQQTYYPTQRQQQQNYESNHNYSQPKGGYTVDRPLYILGR